MLQRKIIPAGRECLHTCCDSTCHRPQEARRERKQIPAYKYKPKENAAELDAFFKQMMQINDPVCANCGSYLSRLKAPFYEKHWKSCQAHLLEKRHFLSLATNPLNVMVLGSGYSGMCNCHDNYDNNWAKASTMHIWPEVKRRFKVLYPLIALNEHQFIPSLLLESL